MINHALQQGADCASHVNHAAVITQHKYSSKTAVSEYRFTVESDHRQCVRHAYQQEVILSTLSLFFAPQQLSINSYLFITLSECQFILQGIQTALLRDQMFLVRKHAGLQWWLKMTEGRLKSVYLCSVRNAWMYANQHSACCWRLPNFKVKSLTTKYRV